MQTNPHHLTLSGRPYCEHTGCVAGMDLAKESGVHDCGHTSKAAAVRAARKLRAVTCVPVRVVAGECPAVSQ